MKNIKASLRRAAIAYYNGSPIMSDSEFDRLAELVNYEDVGASSKDNRYPHAFQMFSLQKVFDNEIHIKDPFNSYKGAVTVSPKLDGAAVSLLYVGGRLHRALTRGDGKKGLDITCQMRTLAPANFGLMYDELPEYFQVTGEVVAPKTIKNARNYAAGALNLKDIEEFKLRDLHFIAYGISPFQEPTWSEDLQFLKQYGFDTVIAKDWTEYPDDGIVFRIDDNAEFESRGYTSHHPRGAYALKQIQTGVVTTLLDVVWNVGKSGVVAPVAMLEPIDIDGATVSKATLHNTRYIEDMGLYLGCKVEVIRSGEIIPRIVRRVG
jgi:DNA ligase (NAD+)